MNATTRFKITGKGPDHHSVGVTIAAALEVDAGSKSFLIRGRYTIPDNAITATKDASLHSQIVVTNVITAPWRAYTRRPVETPVPISAANETIKGGLRTGEFEIEAVDKITTFDPNETQILLVSIGPYVSNVLVIRSK